MRLRFDASSNYRSGALGLAFVALSSAHAVAQDAAVASKTSSVQEAAKSTSPQAGDVQPPPQPTPLTFETLVLSTREGVPLTYAGGRDTLESDTIATYPGAAFDALVRRVPGVSYLPENGNDSRINVGIRGNDPRRSALAALLVDGIPICEAPYGNTDVDGMPITMERITKIDVIRGGASLRYGPNNAGGVINFLTEPVPGAPMIRLGGRVGSDGEYSASLAVGGTWGPYGVLVSGVTKGGDGFRDNGEYTDHDAAVKFDYALSATETISAYFSRFVEPWSEQPGGLTQAAYDADPDQSLRPGAQFYLDTNRYVLGYTNTPDAETTFQVRGWYQQGYRELDDFRPVVAPFTVDRVQESEFNSGALEASYSYTTRWFGIENKLFHSARYLMEENDEFYWRKPIGGGPFVQPFDLNALFKGRSFAIFNEDVMSLSDTVDWAVGFRGESITMQGRSRDDGDQIVKDYTKLLPETNLTWRCAEDTALYASAQKTFYPPQYETGFDPASVIYAPTDPESSNAYEVGVRSRSVPGLEASVALFRTDFTDKIDYINTSGGVKIPVNSDDVQAQGIELGLDYELGAAARALEGFSVYATLTEQRSEIQSGPNEGNDTPGAPHTLASWGVQYDHERSGTWVRVGGSYTGGSFKDLANTPTGSVDGVNGPVPSFTLWDAALGWRQNPDGNGFSVTAGVTNLFDEEYFRRFSTGIYPGAPTQAYLAVTYSFSI